MRSRRVRVGAVPIFETDSISFLGVQDWRSAQWRGAGGRVFERSCLSEMSSSRGSVALAGLDLSVRF